MLWDLLGVLFHSNHLSRSDSAGRELWGSSHGFRLFRSCSLPASAGRGAWVWVAGEEVPKVRAGSPEPVAELWELHFPEAVLLPEVLAGSALGPCGASLLGAAQRGCFGNLDYLGFWDTSESS